RSRPRRQRTARSWWPTRPSTRMTTSPASKGCRASSPTACCPRTTSRACSTGTTGWTTSPAARSTRSSSARSTTTRWSRRTPGRRGSTAAGRLPTTYLSSLLYRHAGVDYLAGGSPDTKFIRPAYEDEVIEAHARVVADDGRDVRLEVWCEVEDGVKCTVGEAS